MVSGPSHGMTMCKLLSPRARSKVVGQPCLLGGTYNRPEDYRVITQCYTTSPGIRDFVVEIMVISTGRTLGGVNADYYAPLYV